MFQKDFIMINYQFSQLSILTLCSAVAILTLGIYILFHALKKIENWSFFIATLTAFMWLSGKAMCESSKSSELALLWYNRYSFLGIALIAPSVYFLVVSLIGWLQKHKRGVVLAYLVSVVFYILANTTSYFSIQLTPWGYYPKYDSFATICILYFLILMIYCFYLLTFSFKSISDDLERKQLKIFFIGLLLAFTALTDFMPAFEYNTYPSGYISILTFIVIAAFAIKRHGFLVLKPKMVFRMAFNSINSFIIGIDTKNRIDFINNPVENILGYKQVDMFKKPVKMLFPEQEKLLQIKNKILKGKTFMGQEDSYFLAKNGKKIPIGFTLSPIHNKGYGGRIIGFVLTAQNITEHKKAEDMLQKSEEKYRNLVEITGTGYLILDLEGKVLDANSEYVRLSGHRSLDEILGRSVLEWTAEYDIEQSTEGLKECVRKGFIRNLGIDYILKNGKIIPVELNATVIETKEGSRILSLCRDITERKQREKEIYRLNQFQKIIIDNADIWLDVLDKKLNIILWNKAAEKISGYSRGEVMGHNKIWKWLYPDEEYRKKLMSAEGTIIGKERRRGNSETTILCKDGQSKIITWHSQSLFDEDGTLIGSLVIGRDITEYKKMEKKLKQTMEDLARSNKELQQFAFVASHDLQEPLRMVSSYTQLLAKRYKGRFDSDADDFIAYAVDGSNRMRELINKLLAYSRVDTHGNPFVLINCEAILDSVLVNLKVAIERSGAVITRDFLPTVMGDEVQIGRLFQNLIDNAIKFRGKKPPHIHISAKQRKNEWLFSISDNGIGIDPKYNKRVFIIFQRLYSRVEYPGSGVGLAICKKIVEHHGGYIWLKSQPGKGTTFYFTIPIKKLES